MMHLASPRPDARYQAPLDGRIIAQDLGQDMVCERVTFGEGLAVCRAFGVCARDTTLAAPDDQGPRLHLQVITQGQCVFTERSRERPLERRSVTLIHADGRDAAWAIPSTEPVSVLSIDISDRRLMAWFDAPSQADWRDRLAATPSLGVEGFQDLAGLIPLLDRKTTGRLTLEASVLGAISSSLRPVLPGEGSLSDSHDLRRRLEQVRDLVEQGGPDARSLSALAEVSGMSPRRLNIAYRRAFGTTLFQALLNARLAQAFAQLKAGDRPIKQIAWQAGYDHPTSFTHAFRRHFGVTPRSVRFHRV